MSAFAQQTAMARVRRGRRVGYLTDAFALEALPRGMLRALKNRGSLALPDGGEIQCPRHRRRSTRSRGSTKPRSAG